MKIIVSYGLHVAALLGVMHACLSGDKRMIGPTFMVAVIFMLLGIAFAQADGEAHGPRGRAK